MIGTAVLSVLLMWIVNSSYSGIVVAKLPFEPWQMVKGMSHRGLDSSSSDSTDVSAIFIYILL